MTVVTLIGYRATGKSSVAPQLAARLNYHWIDADQDLEQRTNRSIPDIFATEGEAEFRRLEAKYLHDLLAQDKLVIASGGGAILNAQTRRIMQSAGPVVWLTARIETIAQRLSKDEDAGLTRPSLTGADIRDEVRAVLDLRQPLYRETAAITVSTDERTVDDIVNEIMQQLADTQASDKGSRS